MTLKIIGPLGHAGNADGSPLSEFVPKPPSWMKTETRREIARVVMREHIRVAGVPHDLAQVVDLAHAMFPETMRSAEGPRIVSKLEVAFHDARRGI